MERSTGSTSAAHAAMITQTRCIIAPGSFVWSSLHCRYSLLSCTMLDKGRRTERDDMDQHTEVILAIFPFHVLPETIDGNPRPAALP